jgi:hypothetical protein
MQRTECSSATIEVANNREISGMETADEISRSCRTGKERSFWRIASLTFLGILTIAAFFAAVAPLPARADNDKDSGHGHEDNDKVILAKIAALEAQVAALQDQVSTLQSQLATVQSNNALLLGPFVSVDPNPEIGVIGPNIIFSGANIHIVSGSGATDDNGNRTGLGNVIIGYDENQPPIAGFPPLGTGDRGGSHNLVVGRWHRFTQAAFGGFVAGEANTISNDGASISGGSANVASGSYASVSGGWNATASGEGASVSGGGGVNIASGRYASISGGFANIASGDSASVSGGEGNTAGGVLASVSGGHFNRSTGELASISGGLQNTAGGTDTVVIGGQNVTNNKDFSIAPQPPFP